MFSNSSADYRPLFWMGGRPVSVTLFLIIVHTVAMLAYALAKTSGHLGWLTPLELSSSDILNHGRVWQLVTYPFVAEPSIGFVIEMFMLYWFGPDVEQFVGRNYFIGLYTTLIVIPGLFLTGWGYFFGTVHYFGVSSVLFGLFVAFVAIYPHVEMFLLRITAFWFAAILIGIYTVIYIANGRTLDLAMIWLSTGIAALLIRSLGVATGFGFIERIREWFENRYAERAARKQNLRVMKEQEKVKSIDLILDKISKHGMGSLTPSEKYLLEQASADLIKRDKNH
jgi:membrane associated rhomboid family serine protease